MRIKSVVGATAGAIGAAAIGNRLLSRRVEPLGPPLERETGTYRWRGMDIAYTEGGDPEDPDMVLVHGIHRAGTSREFNRIFERLAESYHVFAPDLPGFGRSDRPPLTYSATLYETFLTDFINDLCDEPIAVGSGVSGAYLARIASDLPLEALFLVCPKTRASERASRSAGALLRSPLIGETGFNVLASRRAMSRFLRTQSLYDPEALSEQDTMYFWQSTHQPGSRFAPASMLAGDLDVEGDLGIELATLDIDVRLIWGRSATNPMLQEGRELAETADAKLVVLDRARTLPHLEQAGAFLDILSEELEAVN